MAIGSDYFSNYFGNSSLGQIANGAFGEDFQKDYTHASKLFVSGNMGYAPRQKFLFHVFFTLRDPGPMKEIIKSNDIGLIGALVKSIQLPSFRLDTEEHVQYNRKRLVHNRIKYNPVQVVLHDDSQDIIRSLWAKYYEYHFADSSYQYDEGIPGDKSNAAGKTDYNGRDIYAETRRSQDAGWGKTIKYGSYDGRKLPFFKDIKIFGLSRGHFASYTLINPVITSWTHDTYDYAQGNGVMQHTAEIQYEAVKYGYGKISKTNVDGFAEPSRYDTSESALGTSASLSGPGGLADSFDSISTDLANGNVGGALRTLGSSAQSFGSVENLINVVQTDSIQQASGDILGAIGNASRGALNFPSLASSGGGTTATPTPSDD